MGGAARYPSGDLLGIALPVLSEVEGLNPSYIWFCRNRYKTATPAPEQNPSPAPLLALQPYRHFGTVVAHLHPRFIAESPLKVLNMPERHPGASPLAEIVLADCSACPHRALLEKGHCVPGDVCVTVQSGRQIDRFLRRSPQFAADYLNDGFWERRAIAARYAPLEVLRAMPRDADEVVRRVVVSRLAKDELADYLRDPDREVRMTVANRLAPESLGALIGDEDYLVRLQVAKRLPHGQLRRMADDEDREVRKEVARRLPPFALSLMMKDADAEVRRIVAQRCLPDDAAKMLADEDWVVRLEAAQRAPLESIAAMVDDAEADVRAAVRQRLNEVLF
jgi:hypothetical protein